MRVTFVRNKETEKRYKNESRQVPVKIRKGYLHNHEKSIGAIGLILMLFVLAACTEDDNESAEETQEEVITSVQTEEVEEGELTRERTFNARLEPSQTTPIMIEQPLEVDTLEVNVGDTVEEDETVAELTLDGNTQSVDAPEAGEVIQIQAGEGENIDPEEPFMLIADTDEWKAEGSASESMLNLLNIDDEVEVTVSGEEKTAAITNIDQFRMIPDYIQLRQLLKLEIRPLSPELLQK